MAREITFSQTYPVYHHRKGQKTNFIEKIWSGFPSGFKELEDKYCIKMGENKPFWDISQLYTPKFNTIRQGHKWKEGDFFKPMCWAGKPYNKTENGLWKIQFAPEIQVKRVINFKLITEDDDGESDWSYIDINGKHYTCYANEYLHTTIKQLALNDGFEDPQDFFEWFQPNRTRKQRDEGESKVFDGQIIIWNDKINY